MTRDELLRAIAKDAQKRATVKDGVSVRVAYLREAEAVLESIEAAGWYGSHKEPAHPVKPSGTGLRFTMRPGHFRIQLGTRRWYCRIHPPIGFQPCPMPAPPCEW